MPWPNEPPDLIVGIALDWARRSPCAKSQRGAVVFSPSDDWCVNSPPEQYHRGNTIDGCGTNGPPAPFTCDGSAACRASCGRICVHAEARAVRRHVWSHANHLGMMLRQTPPVTEPPREYHLVHVKAINGKLVAGGPPSCEACSKEILDSDLVHFVWLYEAARWHDELRCRSCGRRTVVGQGEGTTGVCASCPGLLERPSTRVYDPTSGSWHRYTALEFHTRSLANAKGAPLHAAGAR